MDDNFVSIVGAIREGRTIFDNIAKSTAYTCVHLVPETVPTLFNLLWGVPVAMASLPILAIDCGTELGPAIAYAYEPVRLDLTYPAARSFRF